MNFSSEERTDTAGVKLELLRAACATGRHDLALSLCESLKDTLDFERQLALGGETILGHGRPPSPTSTLPAPWREWARGWSHYRTLAVFETAGLARAREPLEVWLSFPATEPRDPHREVRLARIDIGSGVLEEVPFQIQADTRRRDERLCRLLFFARVPMHGRATYLVFHGNPWAELPEYPADLESSGDGCGLEISTSRYTARLSEQMGQLERLAARREHSLELYAGGKGHGEPPTIDWAHDYVDAGGFQKLRMRNWARPPNFEVRRGPLSVEARRWGFPHSPLHPLFAPSRLHMDVTYVFYAGLPYFLKESRFEAVKEVRVEAVRDDEWVFSGYSFTDTLWIDSRGRLHEGGVPEAEARDLWGAGFFHRRSRDAFVALWLDHEANRLEAITHSGTPTLHYPGHGQLWSRYPVEKAVLPAGASLRQRNAYLLFEYRDSAAREVEELRHRLLHPVQVGEDELRPPERPGRAGSLGRPGETPEAAALKAPLWDALRAVRDEQLYTAGAGIVDLGYVYDLRVRGDTVEVVVTMPHRGRPRYDFLVSRGGGRLEDGIRERLLKLPGVREVVVRFTWEPPWSAARLSPSAREALGV